MPTTPVRIEQAASRKMSALASPKVSMNRQDLKENKVYNEEITNLIMSQYLDSGTLHLIQSYIKYIDESDNPM